MRCDAMRCDAMRWDMIRCDAMRMRCDAMRCDAIRCDTIRYDTIRYNTIQYNTIQYNAPKQKQRTDRPELLVTDARLALLALAEAWKDRTTKAAKDWFLQQSFAKTPTKRSTVFSLVALLSFSFVSADGPLKWNIDLWASRKTSSSTSHFGRMIADGSARQTIYGKEETATEKHWCKKKKTIKRRRRRRKALMYRNAM